MLRFRGRLGIDQVREAVAAMVQEIAGALSPGAVLTKMVFAVPDGVGCFDSSTPGCVTILSPQLVELLFTASAGVRVWVCGLASGARFARAEADLSQPQPEWLAHLLGAVSAGVSGRLAPVDRCAGIDRLVLCGHA